MNAYPAYPNDNSPKILLSGASGMLGGALRQNLAARNCAILQLVRRAPGSGQIQWNPADDAAAVPNAGALEGITAAIHLSGASVAGRRWSRAYKREMTESRVRSTQALAFALASLRQPPPVLLVASATGFYGDRGDELLDETSAPGTGFLADLCRQWEAAAQPAVAAGIRVVHLRLGVVFGKGGALARMTPLIRLGLGGRLGSGKQWMSWISLTDAVEAILFALHNSALSGPVNLTAPAPVTNAAFTRALARQLHRPALLPVPAFALRLAFGRMADEALLVGARVYPARLTNAGFRFAHPTVEQALPAALS